MYIFPVVYSPIVLYFRQFEYILILYSSIKISRYR